MTPQPNEPTPDGLSLGAGRDSPRRRGRPRRAGPEADPLARWRGEAWLPEALWRIFEALAAPGADPAGRDLAADGIVPETDSRLAGVRFCLDERRAGPGVVTPRALAELHESSAGGRRRAGRWYTPAAVAEALVGWALEAHLAATGAPAAAVLGQVQVLDPACGAGAFLLAAFHSLCDRLAAAGVAATPGESSPPGVAEAVAVAADPRAVAARLHGWDTDPAALALASARLRWALRCRTQEAVPAGADALAHHASSTPRPFETSSPLSRRRPSGPAVSGSPVDRSGTDQRDWDSVSAGESVNAGAPLGGPGHLVCGDALEALAAGDGRGYGLVVTNPPWLSTRRGFGAGRREALRARYQTAVGQFDAYGLFIELGLRCLSPGGGFGFLVPKPLLTNQQMAPVRALLEAERVTVLADPGPIFAAAVEPLLIAGAAASPAATLALYAPGTSPRHLPRTAVIQPGGVWSWPADPAPSDGSAEHRGTDGAEVGDAAMDAGTGEPGATGMAAAMGAGLAEARLGDWFTITRGLECGKRSPGVVAVPGPGRVPLRRGEDLTGAGLAAPTAWFDRAAAGREHKPAAFFAGPKLLVRRVADRLLAAVDPSDAAVLNTLYLLRPRPGCPWSLEALADWLNDPAQTARFRQRYGTPERLFPYLRQHQLADLPLPPRGGAEGG